MVMVRVVFGAEALLNGALLSGGLVTGPINPAE
jgi:hypothetical protein